MVAVGGLSPFQPLPEFAQLGTEGVLIGVPAADDGGVGGGDP